MLLRLLKLRPLQIFAYFSYPNYTKYMLITLYFSIKLRTAGHRLPGNAHTPRKLRCAAKILYEIMLTVFLCLTKPAFMRRPWRITPCPAVHGWAFLCFVGIISTVSRQLRYSPSRACVCLPPVFLTLWLYLPSCRFAHGYCRGLALCVLVILLRFPSAVAVGSLCACLLFFYAFPSAVAVGSLCA